MTLPNFYEDGHLVTDETPKPSESKDLLALADLATQQVKAVESDKALKKHPSEAFSEIAYTAMITESGERFLDEPASAPQPKADEAGATDALAPRPSMLLRLAPAMAIVVVIGISIGLWPQLTRFANNTTAAPAEPTAAAPLLIAPVRRTPIAPVEPAPAAPAPSLPAVDATPATAVTTPAIPQPQAVLTAPPTPAPVVQEKKPRSPANPREPRSSDAEREYFRNLNRTLEQQIKR